MADLITALGMIADPFNFVCLIFEGCNFVLIIPGVKVNYILEIN